GGQAVGALAARIEGWHSLKEKLHTLLGDAGLYARDPAKFATAAAALSKAEAELKEAEEEWLRLEMLREETGRGGMIVAAGALCRGNTLLPSLSTRTSS